MDRYTERMNLHGTSKREREINKLKQSILNNTSTSLSCKTVLINGVETHIFVDSNSNPNIKEIKSLPNESFSVGDYIEWCGATWLITKTDIDNEVYIDGVMELCNYIIKFQSPDGTILSYPCITSGKSFNNDENKVITLPSNQKSVLLPFDDNTKTLKTDRRLFIDRLNQTPYDIIGAVDNTTYNYGDKGLIYFVTQAGSLLEVDGTLPKDRPDLGICNYFEPTIPTPPTPSPTGYTLAITPSGEFSIGTSRILTPVLKDSLGNVVTTWTANWTINYNGMTQSYFKVEYIGNQCKVTVLDTGDVWDYLGNVLELTCTVSGDTTTATHSGIIYG